MMQLWPTQALERHVATVQDAIKKGVSDPDADARLMSRKYVDKFIFLRLLFLISNYVKGRKRTSLALDV